MKSYKPAEFAKLIGVSVSTLQRWDREGILIADRLPSNRRIYTEDHVKKIKLNRLSKAAQSNSVAVSDVKPVKIKKRGRPGADLTGQYFNELHVIERAPDFVYDSGRHDVMWLCECSCGNKKAVRTTNLVSGGTTSCGCMRGGRRARMLGMGNSDNRHVSARVLERTESMVGKYYGRWYVDSVDYESCKGSDTKIRLNCICECGVKRSVLRVSLMNGSSYSCGCYRAERMAETAECEDLTKCQFGFWTVESRGETRHYQGGGQVIMWNCICKCGTRKAVSRMVLKSGESQSCGCMGESGMRGESVIECCLKDMNLYFERQRSYSDLLGINGGTLSYDFCVYPHEDDDVIFLIEYQGEQHFKPVKFFGGDDEFQKQQEHDRRKREYAASHNICLLEIPYSVRSYDDIFKIIDDFIKAL